MDYQFSERSSDWLLNYIQACGSQGSKRTQPTKQSSNKDSSIRCHSLERFTTRLFGFSSFPFLRPFPTASASSPLPSSFWSDSVQAYTRIMSSTSRQSSMNIIHSEFDPYRNSLSMNTNQKEIKIPKHQSQGLTLAQYVELRNGVPLGHSDSLRNMLSRSFGAGSFAEFWQYWNPIWGYGLGKYIYAPLQQVLPAILALIMTFIISGGIHDLVTMAVSRSITFFFTPWFFLLGIGVAVGRAVRMDLSNRPWLFRVAVNLTYLVVGIAMTILAKRLLAIP